MSDFPPVDQIICPVIASHETLWGVGGYLFAHTLSTTGSTAWPSNNRAIYHPISIPCPFTVRSVWSLNGASVSGNIDIGVLSLDGALIVSSGATAQAGTSTLQIITVTNTVLAPGAYYIAMSASSTSATVTRHAYGVAGQRVAGIVQADSQNPLTSLPTFATIATSGSFCFGIASITTF